MMKSKELKTKISHSHCVALFPSVHSEALSQGVCAPIRTWSALGAFWSTPSMCGAETALQTRSNRVKPAPYGQIWGAAGDGGGACVNGWSVWFNADKWMTVDLGSTVVVSKIDLVWGNEDLGAPAINFKIESSIDSTSTQSWLTRVEKKGQSCPPNGVGRTDLIHGWPEAARKLRLTITGVCGQLEGLVSLESFSIYSLIPESVCDGPSRGSCWRSCNVMQHTRLVARSDDELSGTALAPNSEGMTAKECVSACRRDPVCREAVHVLLPGGGGKGGCTLHNTANNVTSESHFESSLCHEQIEVESSLSTGNLCRSPA